MRLAAIVFLFVFAMTSLALGVGFVFEETRRKRRLRRVLDTFDELPSESGGAELILRHVEAGRIQRFLRELSVIASLTKAAQQAQLDWPGEKLILSPAAGCSIGLAAGYFVGAIAPGGVLGLFLGAAPVLYMLQRRARLMAAFEEQLPEALDLLARSLRAGHTFPAGLELLAADTPEPLAGAFRRVANELKLGSSLDAAMQRLIEAAPLIDIQFFVSAVLLQQETGGNLGEILMRLSFLIRDRFRVRGQVRAVSAQGRLTGMVLLAMPIFVTLILFFTSPEYLFVLTGDKDGRLMLWGAVCGQILAWIAIRRIVNIRI